MKVSELQKFLATRAHPTHLASYMCAGRWCEACWRPPHPADLMVSTVFLDGDGISVADRLCCFPQGATIALREAEEAEPVSVVVSALNANLTREWAPHTGVCTNCGLRGPISQDCHGCVSGEMIPLRDGRYFIPGHSHFVQETAELP